MTMASTNEAKAVLSRLGVETPSWAYGNSGTRFKVFGQPGVPRDPYEKVADAAQVHKYTGAAPTVALHIPWDKVADYKDFATHAQSLGVKLGTINSNTFQDDQYILGSVCAPDPKVRANAVAQQAFAEFPLPRDAFRQQTGCQAAATAFAQWWCLSSRSETGWHTQCAVAGRLTLYQSWKKTPLYSVFWLSALPVLFLQYGHLNH